MRYVPTLAVLFFAICYWGEPLADAQEKKEAKNAIYFAHPHYPQQLGSQWYYLVRVREAQAKEGDAGKAPSGKVIITAEKTEDLPLKDLKDDKAIPVKDKDKMPIMVRCTRLKVESGEKTLYEHVGVL